MIIITLCHSAGIFQGYCLGLDRIYFRVVITSPDVSRTLCRIHAKMYPEK